MPVTAPNAVGNVGEPASYVQVRFGSKTDLTAPKRHFRFAPSDGHHQTSPQDF
jgi:hypothetical protein